MLREELRAGRYPLRPEAWDIFHRKAYYSRERESSIIFDVSIEIYVPGTKTLTTLLLFECKDYGSTVRVDEVEEFHRKMQQVSAHKGTMFSTKGFQSGAIAFARSNRIGLARYFPPDKIKWELHRAVIEEGAGALHYATRQDVLCGLLGESESSVCSRMYGENGAEPSNVPSAFLRSVLQDAVEDPGLLAAISAPAIQRPRVEFLPETAITDFAETTLRDIGYRGGPVRLEAVCDLHSRSSGLRVRHDVSPSATEARSGILGRLRFEPLEIVVYEGAPEGRRRFTLAHELGHVVLQHSRFMEGEYCDKADVDAQAPATIEDGDVRRMEWQANRFASELLLPRAAVEDSFEQLCRHFDLRDRGFGALFVDEQPCNRQAYRSIRTALATRFMVSGTAAKLRLEGLGLLRFATSAPSGGRRDRFQHALEGLEGLDD